MRSLLLGALLLTAVVSGGCLVSNGVQTYDCTVTATNNGPAQVSCLPIGVKKGD